MSKLKNGGFTVVVKEAPILWNDRKRILGLPISLTKYSLTGDKILIKTGLFNTKEDEILLYRVRDIRFTQSFIDKLFGVGTVTISSTDVTIPILDLKHVKHAKKVKEVLSQCVEENKKKNGIRATEVMSGSGINAPSLDANNNGINDDMEGYQPDLDGDGVPDAIEHMQDIDNDGIPDCLVAPEDNLPVEKEK